MIATWKFMNEQQDCVSGPNGYQNCVPFVGYAVVLGQIKVWTKPRCWLVNPKQ